MCHLDSLCEKWSEFAFRYNRISNAESFDCVDDVEKRCVECEPDVVRAGFFFVADDGVVGDVNGVATLLFEG